MGIASSQLPKQQKKPRRKVIVRSLKKLTKHGLSRKRKNKLGSRRGTFNELRSSSALSHLPIIPSEGYNKNVLIPTVDLHLSPDSGSSSGKYSKHSLLSYALSRIALLAKRSRVKLSPNVPHGTGGGGNDPPTTKFSFHDRKPNKPSVVTVGVGSDSTSKIMSTYDASTSTPSLLPQCGSSTPSKEEGSDDIVLQEINSENSTVVIDVNNNKSLRDAVIKRILSSTGGSLQSVKTPEELYRKNLEKFETLLAITATTSSDDDCLDENNNPIRSRIISTSKNRVEVDAYFLDWIKSKFSQCSTKKESSSSDSDDGKNNNKGSSKGSSKKASAKASKQNASAKSSKHGNSKQSLGKKQSDSGSSEYSSGSGSSSNNNYRSNPRSTCVKRGPCAGKGLMGGGAPPAYLDYGCAQTFPGAACRKARDPVIERLKNVDVVEQLTYLVPSECCEEDEEENDCDYYAVCESCGEMEPLPEELKNQLKRNKKCCKKKESMPVTYSRRQRFNFKNQDDDDDGPPFRYDGTQLHSCRCPCCVAGLRRNPNCGCKCCQTMGNSRRVNSFDEIPVGKNPQIRRILCPMEAYEKKMEEVDKFLPEQSGVYKFDCCEGQFERQVPRTPTPIILEVPATKRLDRGEIMDIADGLYKARDEEYGCCPCCDQVDVCEPEPEPIYLPPVYGQFNPCCTPCCNPDMNNNMCNKPATSQKGSIGGSSGSNKYSSNYEKGSNSGESGSMNGSGSGKSGSSSLPSHDSEQSSEK